MKIKDEIKFDFKSQLGLQEHLAKIPENPSTHTLIIVKIGDIKENWGTLFT